MRNLQYEIRISQKNHSKVTMTMSKVYSFFFRNSLFYQIMIYFKYFQKKVHHPYPLFQSDDPNVDDNIILLDNDQGTKETGVYTHNNYDQDYAEYDYKGIINGFCLFSSNLFHKFKTVLL